MYRLVCGIFALGGKKEKKKKEGLRELLVLGVV